VVAAAQSAAAASQPAGADVSRPADHVQQATSTPRMHTLTPSAGGGAAPASARRVTLRTPALSLRHPQPASENTVRPIQMHNQPVLNGQFSDNQLFAVWQKYIDSHPTEHVLVNTMRVSPPRPMADNSADTNDNNPETLHSARQYLVTVDNDIQVQELLAHIPQIQQLITETLHTSSITIHVKASDGPAPPSTWNEREVLAHMMQEYPEFKTFMSTLNLSTL